MNKEEFLRALRRDLSGDVPPEVVEENVRYYREYITGEVEKGRREEEVIDEIGAPRLIAKNIEDTTDMPDDGEGVGYGGSSGGGYGAGSGGGYDSAGEAYSGDSGEGYAGSDDDYGAGFGGYGRRQERRGSFHVFDLSKWYVKLAVILIVFLVIYLVVVIVGGIFTLLAPILGPLLIIWLLFLLLRGPGRRR